MIKFNELKNKVIMRNGVRYFKDEDLEFWGTDTSKIASIKKDNLIIILDNADDFLGEKREYRIKIYNILYKKMNTIYTTDNLKFAQNLLTDLKNYKNLSEEEERIIMSGEIVINNNKIIIESTYLNRDFILFDLVE